MKKLPLCLILVLALVCGCAPAISADTQTPAVSPVQSPAQTADSPEQSTHISAYIEPTTFSDETERVLDILDEQIFFYDLSPGSALSFSINAWIYEDGKWNDAASSFGESEYFPSQLATRLSSDSLDFFLVEDVGNNTLSVPLDDNYFEDYRISFGDSAVTERTELPISEETLIFARYASDATSFSTTDLYGNFRDVECDAGVAVTITVYDSEYTP